MNLNDIQPFMNEIICKYEPKDWSHNEQNYFIVFDTKWLKFTFFSVQDGYFDPLRKYFYKEQALSICIELNNKMKEM